MIWRRSRSRAWLTSRRLGGRPSSLQNRKTNSRTRLASSVNSKVGTFWAIRAPLGWDRSTGEQVHAGGQRELGAHGGEVGGAVHLHHVGAEGSSQAAERGGRALDVAAGIEDQQGVVG